MPRQMNQIYHGICYSIYKNTKSLFLVIRLIFTCRTVVVLLNQKKSNYVNVNATMTIFQHLITLAARSMHNTVSDNGPINRVPYYYIVDQKKDFLCAIPPPPFFFNTWKTREFERSLLDFHQINKLIFNDLFPYLVINNLQWPMKYVDFIETFNVCTNTITLSVSANQITTYLLPVRGKQLLVIFISASFSVAILILTNKCHFF